MTECNNIINKTAHTETNLYDVIVYRQLGVLNVVITNNIALLQQHYTIKYRRLPIKCLLPPVTDKNTEWGRRILLSSVLYLNSE